MLYFGKEGVYLLMFRFYLKIYITIFFVRYSYIYIDHNHLLFDLSTFSNLNQLLLFYSW